MGEHRREFDRQLEIMEAKVIELFAMVCEYLPGVTQALLSGSNEVAGLLAERERAIDALYREVEQLVSREILRQAPGPRPASLALPAYGTPSLAGAEHRSRARRTERNARARPLACPDGPRSAVRRTRFCAATGDGPATDDGQTCGLGGEVEHRARYVGPALFGQRMIFCDLLDGVGPSALSGVLSTSLPELR